MAAAIKYAIPGMRKMKKRGKRYAGCSTSHRTATTAATTPTAAHTKGSRRTAQRPSPNVLSHKPTASSEGAPRRKRTRSRGNVGSNWLAGKPCWTNTMTSMFALAAAPITKAAIPAGACSLSSGHDLRKAIQATCASSTTTAKTWVAIASPISTA